MVFAQENTKLQIVGAIWDLPANPATLIRWEI